MNCSDVDSLLPLFFDGELDSKRMRSVALHTARCASCESELRDLELIHEQVTAGIERQLDEIDLSSMWAGVESRLPGKQPSAWDRLNARLDMLREFEWMPGAPAMAAVAAVAALSMLFYSQAQPAAEPTLGPEIASTNYASGIERLDTVFESVAVFSDPDTDTTVLWINDELAGVGAQP